MTRVAASTRVAIWIALAIALAIGRARAGDRTHNLRDGVEVRAWSPWPNHVRKGWAPVFVELRNTDAREHQIMLRLRGFHWYGERTVETRIDLPARGVRSVEMVAPVSVDYSSEFSLEVASSSERAWLPGVVGASAIDPSMRVVLLLSERQLEAGELERWNTAVSSESGASGAPAPASGAPRRRVARPAAAASAPDVEIALVRGDGLARQAAAYSSLDLVILDAAAPWPGAAELAGLTTWLRSGGDVLVMGPNAERAARTVADMAVWMEGRFELPFEAQGCTAYRCGLGRLFVGAGEGDLGNREGPWVRAILETRSSTTPDASHWRGQGAQAQLQLEMLPLRVFAALLILFAILIGPLNFWFVARRKRPVLLLLTIPGISATVTVLLLGYGVLFQGLDVKTASWTTTVLDQRAHRSTCFEKRELFAGLAPAAGLRPDAGTVVHDARTGAPGGERRAGIFVRQDAGLLLSGDLLPTRERVTQALTADRAERARLDIEEREGGVEVVNNLGVRVDSLLFRDASGRLFVSAAPLQAGGRSPLDEAPQAALAERADELLRSALPLTPGAGEAFPVLPNGCYLAQIAQGVFRDDCGVTCNELSGCHLVLGVLPMVEEERR